MHLQLFLCLSLNLKHSFATNWFQICSGDIDNNIVFESDYNVLNHFRTSKGYLHKIYSGGRYPCYYLVDKKITVNSNVSL